MWVVSLGDQGVATSGLCIARRVLSLFENHLKLNEITPYALCGLPSRRQMNICLSKLLPPH